MIKKWCKARVKNRLNIYMRNMCVYLYNNNIYIYNDIILLTLYDYHVIYFHSCFTPKTANFTPCILE